MPPPAKGGPDQSAKSDAVPQDVATINLNEEISPIPDEASGAKGSNKAGNSEEPPF